MTILSTVELSPGLASSFPASIFNFDAANPPLNRAQSGLLPSGSGAPLVNPSAHIYVMDGTMPIAPTLGGIPPATNILIDFAVANNVFITQMNVNPVVISTSYVNATGTGAATWFWWVVTTPGYANIYQQAIGSVGLTGSGADLEISDTLVTSGQQYRILNLRVDLPTLWNQTI